MILPLLAAPSLLGIPSGLQGPMPRPKISRELLPLVDAPNTKGWAKAGITPDDLARRADARLAAVKNSISEWLATVNLPQGNGQSYGRNVFYTPGRFRIEVLQIGTRRYEELSKIVWDGSGGKVRVLNDAGWSPRLGFRTLPTPLAPAFLTGFDNAIMRGTQGAKPITTLVVSARKIGFTALVERHRYGKESELRLVLTKGKTRYAISWRERLMLPTQVWLQSVDIKGKPTRIFWSCAWAVKGSPLTPDDVKNVHPASDQRR